MSLETQPYQPTKEEQEGFDFCWQHLRRNAQYIQDYKVHCEAETMRKELCVLLDQQPYRANEIEQSDFDRDRSRNVGGLGVWIDSCIEDAEEALRQVLMERPDYFQSPLWPQARLNIAGSVVWWNQFGARDCAWSGGTTSFRNFHGRVAEFHKRIGELDVAEANKDNGVESMQQYLDCKAEMRKFLESSPRMDFVIDTSQPITTIMEHLQRQLAQIKDLRERVGLERDVDPSRLRDWKKHLEIWDKTRKHAPIGQPKFDKKLLRKLSPTLVNKLGNDVGLTKITPTQYKRNMDAQRQRAIEAFQRAEMRIAAAFP